MDALTLEALVEGFGEYKLAGDPFTGSISKVGAIDDADSNTIVWVSSGRPDRYDLVGNTNASLIICDQSFDLDNPSCNGKSFVVVADPKLSYLRIITKFFVTAPTWGIHDTAVIDEQAVIHPNTYIGPYCVVGKATIGEGTVLHGHCFVYDNSLIGKNVVMHAHTVVGSDGFGFVWNDDKEVEKFPHIGRSVIEDDVELYPFSNVDRGALFETRIGKGTKIDHMTHIGHNSTVGKNTIITAGTVMCGGSQIGDNTWVGVNSIIKEKAKVGNNSLVGLGSIVTKDIPDGETWMGAPARKLKEFVKLQNIFKRLIRGESGD
jgi:UDP-3-O-[3-hydroxymyristoyl] glucosamine N-acyltransferase